MEVHRCLGPGLLESVYEGALAWELEDRGFTVTRQAAIPVRYKGITFDQGYRADLIINEKVLLELKSVEHLTATHRKQIQTYLRLTDLRLGYLLNFGSALLKDGVVRAVNRLPE